jgi:UrcA family protein
MITNFKASSMLFDTGPAAVLLVCILATAAAIGAEALSTRETVRFEELDLSAPANTATLYSRIHSAALRVCTSGRRGAAGPDEDNCAREAEARAVAKINVDALTAYFETQVGQPAPTLAANLAN